MAVPLNARITADGVLSKGKSDPAQKVADYLSRLTLPELVALYAWLINEIRSALQDPEGSLQSVVISLPLLVIVLHLLKRRRPPRQ